MSLWTKASEKFPPLNENVLILYKDIEESLDYENLYYGIATWYKDTNFGFERWSHFTEYQSYYEVVYWMPLVDMPRIEADKLESQLN